MGVNEEEFSIEFVEDVIDIFSSIADQLGLPHDFDTLKAHISSGQVHFGHTEGLHIHDFNASWHQWNPVISFLISGHLQRDLAAYWDYHYVQAPSGVEL